MNTGTNWDEEGSFISLKDAFPINYSLCFLITYYNLKSICFDCVLVILVQIKAKCSLTLRIWSQKNLKINSFYTHSFVGKKYDRVKGDT